MPSVTWSGSGSVLMTLPRTLVPSQSTTPATKGTGTPGAAKATIVKARSSPSVGTLAFSKVVPLQEAQALRRSKKRAPQDAHSMGRAKRREEGVQKGEDAVATGRTKKKKTK